MKNHYFFWGILLLPFTCAAQWQLTKGPYGGTVFSMAVKGQNLYAGTTGGVFRSADKGSTWELASEGINQFTYAYSIAQKGDYLFAATDFSRVCRSGDGGTTWQQVNTNIPEWVGENSVEVYSVLTGGKYVFAGTDRSGIYRSGNDGASWEPVNEGLPPNAYVWTMAATTGYLLASIAGEGIHASLDDGDSWRDASGGLPPNASILALLVTDDTLFAGTHRNGIYRYNGDGGAWQAVNRGLPAGATVNELLAAGDTLLAGTDTHGVYLSGDNGSTWSAFNNGLTADTDIFSLAVMDGTYFAGTNDKSVYRYSPGQNIWVLANNGLAGTTVNCYASQRDKIYIGTAENGVHRSDESGQQWLPMKGSLPLASLEAIAAKGDIVFAGTDSAGVFRSTSGGEAWDPVNAGLPAKAHIKAIAARSNVVFASVVEEESFDVFNNQGVYRSENNGNAWVPAHAGLPAGAGVLAIVPYQDKYLFAATAGEGIYRSGNNGRSWQAVNDGLPQNADIRTLAVDNEDLYAGNYAEGAVYRYAPAANAWTPASAGLPPEASVEALVAGQGNLFAGTYGSGIYRSTDKGASWQAVNNAGGLLSDHAYIRSLHYFNGHLYAGTYGGGVWRRPMDDFYLHLSLPAPPVADATYGADQKVKVTAPPAVRVVLNQNPEGTAVSLFTRSTTRDQWREAPVARDPADTNAFAASLASRADQFDELGMEYFFKVTPPPGYGPVRYSDTLQVRLRFLDGLPLPAFHRGRNPDKDYQLVSFPLEIADNRPRQVFDELPVGDAARCQLYAYVPKSDRTNPDARWDEQPDIEPGKSYWLIAARSKSDQVRSGNGTTVAATRRHPYELILKKGWNQISNPYLLRLSWQKVLRENNSPPKVGKLQVYRTGMGFETADPFNPFTGAFVKYDGEGTIRLKLPVARDAELNGARVAARRHREDSYFESNFTLVTSLGSLQTGGIGLHEQAQEGLDELDEEPVPRLASYLEAVFPHEGFRLGKDMQPVRESRVWEFAVETNVEATGHTLHWENYFRDGDAGGKQLVLYDVQAQRVVDMLAQASYACRPGGRFRVVYGPAPFVRGMTMPERSVLQVYPNPFAGKATLRFTLPPGSHDARVRVRVFDGQGQQVGGIGEAVYGTGFHQLDWQPPQSLPGGLYLVQLEVSGPGGMQRYCRKVLKNSR